MSNTVLRRVPALRAGFALVELLVIIAIIAVLAALQLPALAGAKNRTKVAQCSSNLRQFALAMQIYANEYNDQLPRSGAGFWAWDLPWNTGPLLNRYGAPASVMYCPGTAPRFSDADNALLYIYASGNFHVLGYAMTLTNTAGLSATDQNASILPQPIQIVNGGQVLTFIPSAAERVLVADATISAPGQNNESQRNTYNYTSISGGYSKAHLSPHLTGAMPAGGNLGMLDGHVEWRKFQDMHVRTIGSSSPTFWW